MEINHIGVVQFHPTQRDHFRSGDLAEKWVRQYPDIFDENDLRLAHNQPQYHFFEWLGAIVLHATMGYLSLVEKYEFANHPRKVSLLRQMLPQPVLDLLTTHGVQCPDLFVYSPDRVDWFFCEVKGLTDKLREEQEAYFRQIGEASGRAVGLLEFKVMAV